MCYILSKNSYQSKIEIKDKRQSIKNCENNQNIILSKIDLIELEIPEGTIYSKTNKVRLNELKLSLIGVLQAKGCWINYALEKCLKRELPLKIRVVCLRTKESIKANKKMIAEWKIELDKQESESLEKKTGNLLMLEIYNDSNYESIKEMFDQRQWACMVDLIETGTVKRNQLAEYGIEIKEV